MTGNDNAAAPAAPAAKLSRLLFVTIQPNPGSGAVFLRSALRFLFFLTRAAPALQNSLTLKQLQC